MQGKSCLSDAICFVKKTAGKDPHTLQEMPITAVALKPCASGSFRGAVTKGCVGLAPVTAVPGAFAAQAGTPEDQQPNQVIEGTFSTIQSKIRNGLTLNGAKRVKLTTRCTLQCQAHTATSITQQVHPDSC